MIGGNIFKNFFQENILKLKEVNFTINRPIEYPAQLIKIVTPRHRREISEPWGQTKYSESFQKRVFKKDYNNASKYD